MSAPTLSAPTLTPSSSNPSTFETNADYFFGTYIGSTFVTWAQSFASWTSSQTFSEVQEKGTATISDDAAGVFTLPSTGGFADIIAQPNGTFPLMTECASIFFDAGTTPNVAKLTNGAGTLVDVVSGASDLSGTTGSDGKLTIAVDSSGDLRLENRLGTARTFWVTFRGA